MESLDEDNVDPLIGYSYYLRVAFPKTDDDTPIIQRVRMNRDWFESVNKKVVTLISYYYHARMIGGAMVFGSNNPKILDLLNDDELTVEKVDQSVIM